MNKKITILSYFKKVRRSIPTILLGTAITLSGSIAAEASVSNQDGFIHQTKEQKQALKEKWGIELVAMRSTAVGYMIDFRYRVHDAKKAAPLFKRQTKPYLIHQSSGKALAVPNTAKLGSLRTSNTPQNGRTYWMFFGNQRGLIHKGDKVTVAIGDFRVTDIEVK